MYYVAYFDQNICLLFIFTSGHSTPNCYTLCSLVDSHSLPIFPVLYHSFLISSLLSHSFSILSLIVSAIVSDCQTILFRVPNVSPFAYKLY